MSLKDSVFGILMILAVGLVIMALIVDLMNISDPSWTLTSYTIMLEMGAIITVFIAINIGWSSTLARILSLCFLGSFSMGLMIEGENLQPYFTEGFVLGALLLCIVLGVVGLMIYLYLWFRNKQDLFDYEVVEVKPL